MKKKMSYTEAHLEVVMLKYQDIVTTSGPWSDRDENVDPDGWI